MAEEISQEEVERIEKEAQITPRRRRKREEEEPLELSRLSGEEVVRILDFLHRRYLSWMTEAESTKYAGVYKTAKDEALKEALETYAEIQKQNQELISRLEKLITVLAERVSTQPPQQPVEQVRSILDDPRVRGIVFIILETLLRDKPTYQEMRKLLIPLLFPESTSASSEQQPT